MLDTLLVLAVLSVAVGLFIADRVRVDAVALGAVLALLLSGVLTTDEAFAGFSNNTVLSITFLFVVGGAIWQTGLADQIGRRVLAIAGSNETRLLVVLMVAVAVLSGFMSNTGTVAVLLPAVAVMARRGRFSPAKLLIPLSYGSMLGGAATLIGTPPNLIVSGTLESSGADPFGFFSFLPFGLVILSVGLVFMMTIGRRLLPDSRAGDGDESEPDDEPRSGGEGSDGGSSRDLVDRYGLRVGLCRLVVGPGSTLVGRTLGDARLYSDHGVVVLKVLRAPAHSSLRESVQTRAHNLGHNHGTGRPRMVPMLFRLDLQLEPDDVLVVEGDRIDVEGAAAAWGLEVAEAKPKDVKALSGRDVGLAEILLPPQSKVIGRSLAETRFDQKYNLRVLALSRPGSVQRLDPRTVPLRFGDTLLVQSPWDDLEAMRSRKRDFVVVGEPETTRGAPRRDHAGRALAVLIAMVVFMVWGVFPVVTVAMMAALAMLALGCMSAHEAYRSIDWRSIVLIAGMLPMSTALEKVGLVDTTADWLVTTLGAADRRLLMAGLFVMTAVFTQVLSNTATTVILAPVALAAAETLAISPRPLLMAVAVAASMAFATPVASPTNTLVMGAGGYRFGDYLKVGVPLMALMLVVSVVLLPVFFPF
jgi:di/tricarboxylate transporter